MYKAIIVCFLLTCGYSTNVFSQTITIYKWTDAKGIEHFSYIMPKDAQYTTFEMKKPPPRKIKETEEAVAPESLSEQLAEQAKLNCEKAQDNLKVLADYSQVKFVDKSGKEQILTAKDKAEYTKLAEKRVALFCNKQKSSNKTTLF
ncbi:DUF4124 domain-containing protein [Pseudoalteromonas denitrificans]|uniref:DUF4124 domain-containing protein n=1 Tax=Pseudoalteromonas denitrificans DSM 6059 TaxID=1123010 RepID=A0A1I1MKN1_9GAMM|nr:DUF4124 domain-containing protein [Pseudoalteromonas denitrificans]SFC85997.1 protein of unknown function [Pseudoalteromonas denitrificans DSM 6059]